MYLRSIFYTSNIGKSKNYVSLILQKYSLNKICTFNVAFLVYHIGTCQLIKTTLVSFLHK